MYDCMSYRCVYRLLCDTTSEGLSLLLCMWSYGRSCLRKSWLHGVCTRMLKDINIEVTVYRQLFAPYIATLDSCLGVEHRSRSNPPSIHPFRDILRHPS